MKTLKNDWLIWLLILFPFVFALACWDKFPDQIPTHFSLSGKPNNYSDKLTGLILLPGINILLYFFFLLIPRIDPSKKNYLLFPDKFRIIRMVIHGFLSFIFVIVELYSLGYDFNTSYPIFYGVFIFILILGNYLGTIRHNYFIGVRTPWTLANESVWNSTHRLAGRIWVAASVVMMLVVPFLPGNVLHPVLLIYIAVIAGVPVLYSYIEYQKVTKV